MASETSIANTIIPVKIEPVDEADQSHQKCCKCFRHFLNEIDYRNHLRIHRVRIEETDRKNNFTCSTCVKSFPCQDWFTAHLKYHHFEKYELVKKGESNPGHCNVCGLNFADLATLNLHVRLVCQKSRLRCSHCESTWSSTMDYAKHLKSHVNVKRVTTKACPICAISLPDSDLHDHFASAHSDVAIVFRCKFCPQQDFKEFNEFREHQFSHLSNPANANKKLRLIGHNVS